MSAHRLGALYAATTVVASMLLAPVGFCVVAAAGNGPTAVANASPLDAAANTAISFDGSSSSDPDGSISSYAWDVDNDGSTEKNGATPSYTYTTSGVKPVTLFVFDNNGNMDRDTINVTIDDSSAPTASLGASSTTVATGTSVTFDASGSSDDLSNGIQYYKWDFDGDSTVDQTTASPQVRYTYASAGSYTATVTVQDYAGKTSQASVSMTVVDLTASATASPTDATTKDTIQYDGSGSTNANSYAWDYDGDGTVDASGASLDKPTHSFGSPGVYHTTLTVSNNGATDTDTVTIAVNDTAAPTAAVDAYPSSAMVDETVTIYAAISTDDLANGIKTYEYDLDDDNVYETSKDATTMGAGQATKSWSSTGTKTVRVRVTDYVGNTDTATTNVSVKPKPTVIRSSVIHTGNGSAPTQSMAVSSNTGRGMLMFHVHPDGNSNARNLSGMVTEDTELWVNFTVDGYSADAMMGSMRVDHWQTSGSQAAGDPNTATNLSVKVHPAGQQYWTGFSGSSPSQWPDSNKQADVAYAPGLSGATFDMPDGSKFEQNMSGATLTSDAQIFMPPRYDEEKGMLNFSVAAPHWNKRTDESGNKVTNTGFYEATIPSGMVDWMGINDPAGLTGTFYSNGGTQQLTSKKVTLQPDGDLHVNVTGIHYSGGPISFEADTTDPTADAGADQSVTVGETVTLDGTASSDDNQLSTYEWDYASDGSYDGTGSTDSTSYGSTGTYSVTLRVTDGNGNTDTDTMTVSVSSNAGGGGGGDSQATSTATATPTATATATPTATTTATPVASPTATSTAVATADEPTDTEPETVAVTTDRSTSRDGAARTPGADGPGFGFVATLSALLAALHLARRRR